MPILPLTLTAGLCLAFTFAIFLLREYARNRPAGAGRAALLPVGGESLTLAHARVPHDSAAHGCGCHTGDRAPCPGCLRRVD